MSSGVLPGARSACLADSQGDIVMGTLRKFHRTPLSIGMSSSRDGQPPKPLDHKTAGFARQTGYLPVAKSRCRTPRS